MSNDLRNSKTSNHQISDCLTSHTLCDNDEINSTRRIGRAQFLKTFLSIGIWEEKKRKKKKKKTPSAQFIQKTHRARAIDQGKFPFLIDGKKNAHQLIDNIGRVENCTNCLEICAF